MIDEYNRAITAYQVKWQKLIARRKNQKFFQALKPVAMGWKVGERAEYDQLYAQLHDKCERTVETWMNGRWVAKMILADTTLDRGIRIVKIMQRRPGSDDALGLDHIDFYSPDITNAESILKQEADLKWSWESNDVIENYDWISLWFDGTEAKLKSNTVIDIVVAELQDINTRIIRS